MNDGGWRDSLLSAYEAGRARLARLRASLLRSRFSIAIPHETASLLMIAAGLLFVASMVVEFLAGRVSPLWLAFGWGAPIVALGLIVGGATLALAPRRGWRPRWMAVIAGEVLFVLLLTAAHINQAEPLPTALAGEGGGMIGWALSQVLIMLAGTLGAWLVVIAGLAASAWWTWRSLPPSWTDGLIENTRQLWANIQPGAEVPLPNGPDAGGRQAPARSRKPAAARPEPVSLPPAEKDKPKPAERPARRKARPATLPPMETLVANGENHSSSSDIRQRAQTLKQTLADFGVPVEIVSIKEGPTVTQFGLEPGETVRELRDGETVRRRVPVARIQRLSNDLALALAAPSIRIEAPVPGRPYVGIEIPNVQKTMVALRGVLESREYLRVTSPLAVALGRDVSGDAVVADLVRMPHLLIAGATGSGKSVCINAIVSSLLMNNGPDSLQLLMVDPKMVELPAYNGIPHLVAPVVTDTSQATAALAWLTLQMDERYRTFAEAGVRNIEEYNRRRGRSRTAELMPYIVLVIDELADLMMVAAYDVERQICRLAQMARATGIHLVLATQRPSVDVITGLIKANFPARIAFAVASQIDSRVILDAPGAEKLLGRGDMLFMAPETPQLQRVQGCFVSDEEIDRLVEFWRATRGEDEAAAPEPVPWAGLLDQAEDHDELLERAIEVIKSRHAASTSLLQRALRIGHPRAARLMEQLEEMGLVGPDEGGGRSRQVLVDSGEPQPGD